VDGIAARHGDNGVRDEPVAPGCTPEHRDEEVDRLGGDHRVPTAITGFYGQNVDYPGINTVGGFVVSTSIIVLLVIGLYWMFRRRDWL